MKPTCRKSWAGNLLMWSHLPLDPSFKVKQQPNLKMLITSEIFSLYAFYPTALKGCRGIVFTHGVRAGGGKKFVRAVSQKP